MNANLPRFTGLRGIAALMVLFFHIRTPVGTELTFGFADPFSEYGFLGVDIFFVLSGFILSHVYNSQFSAGLSSAKLISFAVARFSRIYPLHLATTLLMLITYAVAVKVGVTPTESSGYSATSTIMSLLLIQEWFGVVGPNPGSWSISIEFFNYLAFPFLIFVTSKLPRHWPIAVILLGAYIAENSFNGNLIHGSAEFVMGAAAYTASAQFKFKTSLPLSAIFLALPFVVYHNYHMLGYGVTSLCFTAAVYFLAIADRTEIFARLCATRPLVFLGDISYSVYLLQWFFWIGWKHVLAKLPPFAGHPYLMVFSASATLIAASIGSYYFFERPARAWIRRRLARGPSKSLAKA